MRRNASGGRPSHCAKRGRRPAQADSSTPANARVTGSPGWAAKASSNSSERFIVATMRQHTRGMAGIASQYNHVYNASQTANGALLLATIASLHDLHPLAVVGLH